MNTDKKMPSYKGTIISFIIGSIITVIFSIMLIVSIVNWQIDEDALIPLGQVESSDLFVDLEDYIYYKEQDGVTASVATQADNSALINLHKDGEIVGSYSVAITNLSNGNNVPIHPNNNVIGDPEGYQTIASFTVTSESAHEVTVTTIDSNGATFHFDSGEDLPQFVIYIGLALVSGMITFITTLVYFLVTKSKRKQFIAYEQNMNRQTSNNSFEGFNTEEY